MKLFKLLLFPLFLTALYVILVSYPYFFSKINRFDSLGFLSVIEEPSIDLDWTFSKDRTTDEFDNHLFKGEKIGGKIRATENNLGIILFRFAKLSAVTLDTVAFRIKKEGDGQWYYENKYKADQFQPDQYFTFGFPSVANSKNKAYVFEIESLTGTYKNGTGVSLVKPQVAVVYKYTLRDLKNYKMLSSFIFKKFVYVQDNVNFWENWQILASSLFAYVFFLFVKKREIIVPKAITFLLIFKKKTNLFLKKVSRWFGGTKFYLLFLNTDTKKRVVIGLSIFLFALTYRFSSSLVNLDKLFYAGLGGQGDYDQFIRAATCAVRDFCPAILGQNFLFETSILGIFYELFGFAGGLKAYLYLMMTLSSLVATLPYFLLSRKTWISIGGIIGSIFIATSDFLTQVALNFPPDNGSLFTFSMFFIVYLLALHIGTIRWLFFFGFMGAIDGLNKAVFLISDLSAFLLFIPVFLLERTKRIMIFTSVTLNMKLIFYSALPLLIFVAIYSMWEYFVYIKFYAHYFLGRLIINRGDFYVSYTSFNDVSSEGNTLIGLFYLCASGIVMVKRMLEYGDFPMFFLALISLALVIFTFKKQIIFSRKSLMLFIFPLVIALLLFLMKNNYLNVNEEPGDYMYGWSMNIYVKIFLFIAILYLFVINFGYNSIKLSLPVIPYVIMLIILAKHSPFPRLSVHVIVWSIILLSFLTDWILNYFNNRTRIIFSSVIVIFISVYTFFKIVPMSTQLYTGFVSNQNQIRYLQWVDSNLPSNAVVLAGGGSDLVRVSQNIKKPIVYSSLWTMAVLIKPKEIPVVKPTDFGLTGVLFLYKGPLKMRSTGSGDFDIISELKNKDNFNEKKYIILGDDIYIWRARVAGVADSLFSTSPNAHLDGRNYSIKVYKYSPILKKGIYELNIRDMPSS